MKRIILITAAVLAAIIGLCYLGAPATITFHRVYALSANEKFTVRNLRVEEFLDSATMNSGYTLEGPLVNEFRVLDSGNNFIGSLQVMSRNSDSALLVWRIETIAENNLPWTRWNNYRLATKRKSDVEKLNDFLIATLEKKEHQIKDRIKLTTLQDTLFISNRFDTEEYPSTSTLYLQAEKLRSYAKNSGAQTHHSFIYNRGASGGGHQNMIAIAIDKEIPENTAFAIKKMIRGNILSMELKGGEFSIRKAFDDLENYVQDRALKSPAIPFIQPITNRMLETDTAKWITRINYPIF